MSKYGAAARSTSPVDPSRKQKPGPRRASPLLVIFTMAGGTGVIATGISLMNAHTQHVRLSHHHPVLTPYTRFSGIALTARMRQPPPTFLRGTANMPSPMVHRVRSAAIQMVETHSERVVLAQAGTPSSDAFVVDAMTPIEIMAPAPKGLVHVRVLAGAHSGEEGWVERGWIAVGMPEHRSERDVPEGRHPTMSLAMPIRDDP